MQGCGLLRCTGRPGNKKRQRNISRYKEGKLSDRRSSVKTARGVFAARSPSKSPRRWVSAPNHGTLRKAEATARQI